MATYNVTCKIFRGSTGGDIEAKLTSYINSLDSTKVIRGVAISRYGVDNLLVLIIHDA